MRFTAAAAAVMAGSALAGDAVSTDYTTELITITACPETVTDCPARSTQVSTNVRPVTTTTFMTTRVHTITKCAATVTDCPAHSIVLSTETVATSTVGPVTTSTATPTAPAAAGTAPVGTAPAGGASDNYPAPTASGSKMCGGVPCPPAGSAPAANPPATQPPAPVAPATTEAPACPAHQVTAVTKSYTTVLTSVEYQTIEVPCTISGSPSGPQGTGVPVPNSPYGNSTTPIAPIPTAGAATLAGSAIFAAVAGVAAFVLA
ncbi:hypothetical protein E4U58_007232 [Claviceps cyperi]|nr:hypothetical protein E4U58_007232 [Claviceps cyperi]